MAGVVVAVAVVNVEDALDADATAVVLVGVMAAEAFVTAEMVALLMLAFGGTTGLVALAAVVVAVDVVAAADEEEATALVVVVTVGWGARLFVTACASDSDPTSRTALTGIHPLS